MLRLSALVSALLGFLVVGCVDLTPMWEKQRDAASGNGGGGAIYPGTGGILSGGEVATGGTVVGTGGIVVDAALGADVTADNDGPGPAEDSSTFADAGAVLDVPSAGDVVSTGGVTKTDGAVDKPDVPATGGVKVDAALPDASRDTARDTAVIIQSDAPVDAAADTASIDSAVAAGPFLHYTCDNVSTGQLTDSSGNGQHAALVGAYSLATGKAGGALDFNQPVVDGGVVDPGYATIPADSLSSLGDVTITAWVRLHSNPAWSRIFDFGSSQSKYLFLTPAAVQTGKLRFAITANGINSEQRLEGPAMELGRWTHLAIVLGPQGGQMFVDGQVVSTNSDMSLRPSALGGLPETWIGKSRFSTGGLYNDPYLDGSIDEFRIYDRALSASEITALLAH